MDVSHFELVYKPQSPAGPADTVLQGYFLEISNLENIDLEFSLRLTTSAVSDPDRSLFGNAAVFVDTPGSNNNIGTFSITGTLTSKSFGLNRRIVVPAHGTALIALLPSDPFPVGGGAPPAPNFECRGYATLSLPAIFRRVGVAPGGRPLFGLVAQAQAPVKVLLTAQNRAVYTDPATGAAKGQSQSSLPLSSGQALNEIAPGQPFVFSDAFDLTPRLMLDQPLDGPFEDVLAGMLSVAAQSGMNLGAFNKALKKAGIGMALEDRKVAVPA